MNLDEYKRKQELYERFTEIVEKILSAAIQKSKDEEIYQYHLQQIQCRAKTYESLEKRLLEQDKKDADNIEEIRDDLAGCRIIFYYNNDINVFLSSGLVEDNFKVIEHKIYGPKDEIVSANDFYTANHYIIKLNDNRVSLPEYAVFKGLKCEIQIHTILTHAWSETSHKAYKWLKTPGFASHKLDIIDKRLQKIMKDYIIPAGYEFQNVQYDYQCIFEGKVMFDRNVKQEIINCQNNNERHEILEQFRERTLPFCDAEYVKENLDTILEVVRTAVSLARDVKSVEIDTPFGSMKGKTFKDIFVVSLSILNFIQYFDVELTFSNFVELYKTSSEEEKKLIHKSTAMLVKYNVKVLSEAGFFVQDTILRYLEKLDETTLTQIKGLVTHIGYAILDAYIEDVSSNYKSVTIKHASLSGNKNTRNIRERMLTLLKKIYTVDASYKEKCEIIKAFNMACGMPHLGNYSDALLTLILRNSENIVDFYTIIIPTENYEILESIEAYICFLYQRSTDILEGSRVKDGACLQQCNELIASAIRFREELNKNDEYVIYKTLVGFESVFEECWNDNMWKIHYEEQYRLEKIEEYVNNINDGTKSFWGEIIIICTQAKSNDLATFVYFGKFLKIIAEQKPDFVFYLLKQHENELSSFLCPILDGLMTSTYDKTINLMHDWVDNGKYLNECARVFEYHQPLDEVLVTKIFNQAKIIGDTIALIKVITAAIKNYDSGKSPLIKNLLLPAVQELTKLKNTKWVFDLWYRPEWHKVAGMLDKQEISIILDNLLLIDKINYQIEKILEPIAEKQPQAILEFFKNRIFTKGDHNNFVSHFEPVPFNFTYLHKPLSTSKQLMLDTIISWYDGEYGDFIFGGAKLIHNIFPIFSDELEKYLIDLVNMGREEDPQIVMAILRNYNGNLSIYPTYKKLVKVLPKDSKLLSEVMNILISTGVVEGEFGLVNAYKEKKQEIEDWKQDDNQKVQDFATEYISRLDKMIISEQRRTKEDIELQKHQFGNEEEQNENR